MDNPQNVAVVLGVLLSVSEALSLIPTIKANGIFQLSFRIIRSLSGKKG
jgi:hypothetical protein